MSLTKEDLIDICNYLTSYKYESISISTNPATMKRIDELENKIISMIEGTTSTQVEQKSTPDTIELIISRLLEQKQKINDELSKKYKKQAIDEKWSVEKTINIFNKREPQLTVQLFFIDMELRNLGYEDS